MQARRSGFTLVELLMVVFVGALVLAAVLQTLSTQDRSVRHSYAVIGTQQNSRTAIDVLTSDLREVSATDGDILAADSVFISIRALRKAAVVCDVDPSGGYVEVAEVGDRFIGGDSVLIFADGPIEDAATDDSWLPRGLTSTPAALTCTTSPISSSLRRLNVSPALPMPGVWPGALVRSWVPVHFRLVDNGTMGVLTRVEAPDSVPLVTRLAPISRQGLRFRFWDTLNVAMPYNTLNANLNSIGRIQVKVLATGIGGVSGAGREISDSLVSTIQLRGNRKLR
jgi:prepilin-type N-terminal cleavage/methylation domain-containing protein